MPLGIESDARAIAIASVIAVAPFAIIIIIALLRGYRIKLSLERNGQKRDRGE